MEDRHGLPQEDHMEVDAPDAEAEAPPADGDVQNGKEAASGLAPLQPLQPKKHPTITAFWNVRRFVFVLKQLLSLGSSKVVRTFDPKVRPWLYPPIGPQAFLYAGHGTESQEYTWCVSEIPDLCSFSWFVLQGLIIAIERSACRTRRVHLWNSERPSRAALRGSRHGSLVQLGPRTRLHLRREWRRSR